MIDTPRPDEKPPRDLSPLRRPHRSQFDVEPKRIIFQGRILNKDGQTLQDCKLKDGLTVVVQVLAAGASASPLPAAATAPAAAAAAAAPATPNPAAGLAAATQSMSGLGLGAVSSSPVGQAVATVSRQPAGVARECLATLTKVIDNIKAHPTEEKYRKIKRANAGFSRKVGWGRAVSSVILRFVWQCCRAGWAHVIVGLMCWVLM